MKSKNIIFIASVLLSFCLSNAMENPLAISTNIASRPAPKKYRRYLAPAKITPDLLILEMESFLDITSDQYETIPTEEFTTIEENFKKSFGYSIPTSVHHYTKTNFKKFINHNDMIIPHKGFLIQKPLSQKIEIITNKALRYHEQQEREKIAAQEILRQEIEVAAEKQRQEMLANKLRLRNEKLANKEKLLREKLAAKEQLAREKEIENERLKQIQEELNKKIEQLKLIDREITKQRIINAQKKEQAAKAAQKKIVPKKPVQRPEKSIIAQKFALKKKLMASYNFKTEAQLKEYFYQLCSNANIPCTADYISGTHTLFHYSRETGELAILISDHEIKEYSECRKNS